MDMDATSFLTGFSNSLNAYLGMKNQYNAAQNQEIFKNKLANASAIAKEGRELANAKELKGYDAQMDLGLKSALKAYELTLEGKVDPQAAAEIFPEAASVVEKFNTENGRNPTTAEFKTLIEPLSKNKTEKQPKEWQFKAAGYYKRAAQGVNDLEKLEKTFDATGLENVVQSKLPQVLKGDKYRQFQQARDNFITAYLRRDSGAAIAQSEYETADRQFFPMPGDSKDVLRQKAANRRGVLDSLKNEATGKEIDLSVPSSGRSTGSSGASEGWSITKL